MSKGEKHKRGCYLNFVQTTTFSFADDFEEIENINEYKMSISKYCVGNINIPVYTKNGKIVNGLSKSSEVEFVEMKIKSEKELKDENVEIFDYTTELEEDGYYSITKKSRI